ncbi:MAG: hypothetical protein DRG83_03370 [Deltaproteobacteria bacterium]|nr:MAG: hypothetical protein DRG83_03370 [Deltaproteobacteria bacterium]
MNHRKIAQQVQELGEGRVEIEVLDQKEPVESDPHAEIVSLSLQAVEDVTGQLRSPKGVAYYTDGAVIANGLQIPTVIIGPGDTGMTHQPNEYVEVSQLVQGCQNLSTHRHPLPDVNAGVRGRGEAVFCLEIWLFYA